jgi:hypothetical protein
MTNLQQQIRHTTMRYLAKLRHRYQYDCYAIDVDVTAHMTKFVWLLAKCRNNRDLTRIWNLVDHYETPEHYWAVMLRCCPEFFLETGNPNSARFTY